MKLSTATRSKSRHARADWFANSRLKLRHLTVLIAIERIRSFGRAAAELHTRSARDIQRSAPMPTPNTMYRRSWLRYFR